MFIVWASFAQVDELARANGEVIPSGENQMVQNLEGGIVEEILVKEGAYVKKGQILVKIDNQKSQSSFSSNEVKRDALEARILRLKAEANGTPFVKEIQEGSFKNEIIENEYRLYITNEQQLSAQLNALKEQLNQKKEELSEAKMAKKHLAKSLKMIQEEVSMIEPMVEKGIRSKVNFLQLQREENDISQRYNGAIFSISKLEAAIEEVNNKIKESKITFRSEAQQHLNETIAQLQSIKADTTALEDQVNRTYVRSPMNGIVQTLYVHTIGGVIKPGADILEIVPNEQTLLVEVKVKPSDIGFLYFGQKAVVKFSAYDYSIYGGLEGKVSLISADTTKEKDQTYYIVQIKTDKNYLGSDPKPLKLIPGMTVTTDIITGKKSVLDYILKPILKTKQYTFTER